MKTNAWLVTATPPTPNGDLHLGHLSGPYLAADIFARHLRQRGQHVKTITGIDDHQSYTQARAIRDRNTAEHTAQWFGDRIIGAWNKAHVNFDVISRPQRERNHRSLAQTIFLKLFEQGDIVARVNPLPYCAACERWAYEAYVKGECPHCGEQSCGNVCESCCHPNDCADLKHPRCTICLSECEIRPCERLYLPLARHADMLRRFLKGMRMNGHLRALSERMLEFGLPEIAVSHPANWGIEVPLGRFRSHRIYVWFEMAAGYLASGGDGNTVGTWRARQRVVQFFGLDNGYFHSLLFPAIMHAFDRDLPLPIAFITNEFYRLEGLKFSTSRAHAIWLSEALEEIFADHLRIYLAWDRPAVSQTNFRWDDFYTRVHGDLLPRWYGWLNSLARRSAVAASSTTRAKNMGCSSAAIRHMHRRWIENSLQRAHEAYSVDQFSPRTALQQLDLLVQAAAEAGRDSEHLADHPTLHKEFLIDVRSELAAAAAFSMGLYPIAPTMASQLWRMLGCAGQVDQAQWDRPDSYLPHRFAKLDLSDVEPLFNPIAPTTSRDRADELV